MRDRKYNIYIDESGDPIFSKSSSKHLVFSSIIIDAKNQIKVNRELSEIMARYNLREFKSSKIGNEKKRIVILEEILKIDFKVLTLFVLKNKLQGEWRLYKKVLYKYAHNRLNSELNDLFQNKRVFLDRYGSDEYQKSLKMYLDKKLNLFDETILIKSAKDENLLQLSDLFSGTIRKYYSGEFSNKEFFRKLFFERSLRTIIFPNDLPRFIFNEKFEKDKDLAKITIETAELYLEKIKKKEQFFPLKIILEYLIFHAKYHDKKIYTPELIDWIRTNGYDYSEESFRGKIIGKLRDEGVVIAGSRSGIKIPTTNNELAEHVSFTSNKVIPMIKRLSLTYDVLNSKSEGALPILHHENFDLLKELFEKIREYQTKS